MRIISGLYRGRKLNPPKGLPVRPTTDLAKESLFNILVNRSGFEGQSVLDLFAGTGSISFEFASRGVETVVAVDLNHRCTEFISKSAQDFRVGNLYVVKANVFQYLKSVKRKFDIIFADPPYQMEETASIPTIIFSNSLLNDEGWLILEHDASLKFHDFKGFVDERNYGKVHFSFFQFLSEESISEETTVS